MLWIIAIICLAFSSCSTTSVKKISITPKVNIEPESQNIERASGNFSKGEKLIYKVEWLGLNVADAVVEIEDILEMNGCSVYKIKLTAKTNGLVAKIFPVNNEYLSYADVCNMYSVKSQADRHEGTRIKKEETLFDRVNQKAYYTDFLKNRKKVVDIPENTYDVLAAAYYFRSMDVTVGDTISYNVFSNGKLYPVHATIKKQEYLSISDLGTFKTFLIEPYIIRDGEVDRRAKVTAYFSADKNRWPVYISLKGPVFTRINIFLKKVENV